MLSHLAFWAPAGLEALTQLCLHGLHFGGNGLEGVLVLLLAFQSFVESPLFLTDLCEKGDLTNGFLLLILQVVTFLFLTALPKGFWLCPRCVTVPGFPETMPKAMGVWGA